MEIIQFDKIIKDRGSIFSVSGGENLKKEDIKLFLTTLVKNKRYRKATHNSYACRIKTDTGTLWETKNDDGETGAGLVILNQMRGLEVTNMIIVVTRWYGGVKLQGDRFRHFAEATKYFIDNYKKQNN